MPDLEQTANPPQEAPAESTEHQPFWDQMDAEATETPEPIAEAEPEVPETVEAEPEVVEEEDADYLPTEQEKIFPVETLAKYAKRYGYSLEEINADPRIQLFLKDKINSDILIAQQREQEQAEEEEPTLAPDALANPQQLDRSQWLEQVVTQGVDQKSVEEFGRNFLVSAGVNPDDPESEAVLKNAGAIGKVLTKGALDLFTTVAPQMQLQMLEAALPGITEMYQRSLYALQWDRVTSGMKDTNLPKYGTPEFATATKAAAAMFPGFEQMVFTDGKGRQLPPDQQIQKQYEFLAKHMTGQKVTPQEVKQAIETGRKQVKDADRNRAAGKALGAGQGKKQLTPESDNSMKSWIEEYNAAQRSTPMKG